MPKLKFQTLGFPFGRPFAQDFLFPMLQVFDYQSVTTFEILLILARLARLNGQPMGREPLCLRQSLLVALVSMRASLLPVISEFMRQRKAGCHPKHCSSLIFTQSQQNKVGNSSLFWQKAWGFHLISAMTWIKKYPVVMS